MIVGIGTDIVENSRFESLSDGFLKRIFTEYEIALASEKASSTEYFASRFAAKEAVAKALGTGFRNLPIRDIEIHEDESGRPYPHVKGHEDLVFHLSISHEKSYSVAMVVVENV